MTVYESDYIDDPGHAWITASAQLLVKLGIDRQVSHFSYISRDGLTVYLEEDCDAPLYYGALTKAGDEFAIGRRIYDESRETRELPHYRPSRIHRYDELVRIRDGKPRVPATDGVCGDWIGPSDADPGL